MAPYHGGEAGSQVKADSIEPGGICSPRRIVPPVEWIRTIRSPVDPSINAGACHLFDWVRMNERISPMTFETVTPVPFDDRLERCVTTTEDGEVLAVSYRYRSELQPAHMPEVRPKLVWALVVGVFMLLARR